jgi:ectoine hydroxylase-related dioxygenase (phytanoyl-CoA dioxygenase family)
MLTRDGYLYHRSEGPEEARRLEEFGFVVLQGVLDHEQVSRLSKELSAVYARLPRDRRSQREDVANEVYRYEMLNRSSLAQEVIAHPRILEVIEPLLGEDCHVIANPCWRNLPGNATSAGGHWHIDSGPHVPRPEGIPWDDRIPYPIFAIGAHLYLQDCPIECGPTGVIPRSHKSGRPPPSDRCWDLDLQCDGARVVPLVARAGDAALFVSDAWHRRLPTMAGDQGRFFLQCHYGRRDLAQRIRPTTVANHLSNEAIARARTARERTLVGLHPMGFYDG